MKGALQGIIKQAKKDQDLWKVGFFLILVIVSHKTWMLSANPNVMFRAIRSFAKSRKRVNRPKSVTERTTLSLSRKPLPINLSLKVHLFHSGLWFLSGDCSCFWYFYVVLFFGFCLEIALVSGIFMLFCFLVSVWRLLFCLWYLYGVLFLRRIHKHYLAPW